MSEQSYFRQSLGNFIHDTASGGAIRHLTDLGYTVNRIAEQLSFPTPLARIRREVWARLLETEVIIQEPPGQCGIHRQKTEYVREYDACGKPSFRQVAVPVSPASSLHFQQVRVPPADEAEIRRRLRAETERRGKIRSYVSCDFGLSDPASRELLERQFAVLAPSDREYVEGLPWESRRVYHLLNARMQGILFALLKEDLWSGDCFFAEP